MYEDRVKDLTLTALVADAYSLGAHWVYDEEQLKNLPINWSRLNAPQSIFHRGKKAGDFTHYGDQLVWLYQFLQNKTDFDGKLYQSFWFQKMQKYDGYIDGSSRTTMENIKNKLTPSGADSSDLSIVGRIAPLLLVSKTKEEFYKNVENFIKITHNSQLAVTCGQFFAKLLINVLNEGLNLDSITNLKKDFSPEFWQMVQKGIDSKDKDTFKAIRDFGPACSINEGLSATVHLLVKYDDLKTMLIENAKAGGDSSARGMAAATIFKAAHPSAKLPQAWYEMNIDTNL